MNGNRMKKEKTILVLAAPSLEDLEEKGADVEDRWCETVAEAKRRARYLTGEQSYRLSEGHFLGYARVLVDGECVADYFAEHTEDK